MRAFIIRPFGKKQDGDSRVIDFDEVEAKLIAPALDLLGVTERKTGEIITSGNIRADMFQLLLAADLVIADLSIHDANVFYELGVRHALRDRHTFLLRAGGDRFPFDLQTNRYFVYDGREPGGSVVSLLRALREAMDGAKTNSPIFASLPNLKEADLSRLTAVPPGFGDGVESAAADRRPGDLRLLAEEARGFHWEDEGLRVVARAQRAVLDHKGACDTWEVLRRVNPYDLEANLMLGAIYGRLGRLTESSQALGRALSKKEIPRDKMTEAYTLLARNAKTLWRQEWESSPDAGEKAAAALRSPRLQESFEYYERAYEEDLNNFYSGFNALVMLKLYTELAAKLPAVWAERFEDDAEAERVLDERKAHAAKLAASVQLALEVALARLKREGRKDVWVEVSRADLLFLTSTRPARVAAAYRDALAGAPDFVSESVLSQLAIYDALGLFTDISSEVFKFTGEPRREAKAAPRRPRVLVFTGHMLDAPGREKRRFPPDKEDAARRDIKKAVETEMASEDGVASGIAGGASGGDILFHEVCEELGVPTQLYLALDPDLYVKASVSPAGPGWVERFWRLYHRLSGRGAVRLLRDVTEDSKGEELPEDEAMLLPSWLRSKPDYGIWQRNNLWMLRNALAAGGDDRTTLIALWDREPAGGGVGGTSDLARKAEGRGAKTVIIDTKETFGL